MLTEFPRPESQPSQPLRKDLGFHVDRKEPGRCEFNLAVGDLQVKVLGATPMSLTYQEWLQIQSARQSFFEMWGGNGVTSILKDQFDARDPESPYQATHYIATVHDPADQAEPEKVVTMRLVSIRDDAIINPARVQLPDDITFWNVLEGQGKATSLWQHMKLRLSQQTNGQVEVPPELKIAAIGRTGTSPYEKSGRTARQREKTAIGFAAIQVLATELDKHKLWVCQLCPEFQTLVLSIRDKDGSIVMLDFAKTEETLNLPPGWRMKLDNNNPHVQKHKTNYPGYWIDNEGAKATLLDFLASGRFVFEDFKGPLEALLNSDDNCFLPAEDKENLRTTLDNVDNSNLADIIGTLIKPRFFKFLIPLINSMEDVRTALIFETPDGPFSSTITPQSWRESALRLLDAAQEKYK